MNPTTAAGNAETMHWPCPHNCHLWVRGITPNEPMTRHHPNCEHVDESLIDVWKVSDGSSSYYDTDEATARHEAEECDDVTITKVKMHREIFENLREFDGF